MSYIQANTIAGEFKKEMLKVKIFHEREKMGKEAAHDVSDVIQKLLEQKNEINIIFAAAPSQNDFMKEFAADNSIQWQKINAFHMDEYIGLDKEAPQGFGNFLKERIFGKVPFKSVHYINGQAENLSDECNRYAGLLQKYPVDIVCLGIGENGHIAFNDPPVADFQDQKQVKVVELEQACRQQQVNDGCFATLSEVPAQAFTLTIPALMKANYMFCMVPTKFKAEAVFHTLYDEINEKCPATILRTKKDAILYLDKASASLLQKNEYYET
ncbi:MAG: glucosamine-6-phosphate deaminase [Tannerella sp.]|jgi:glucosamine-6-phosphate deaminase|nr:glucosamine-6-phosphate deaminase [Tannerella sp.]